jgi:hypothetical protein
MNARSPYVPRPLICVMSHLRPDSLRNPPDNLRAIGGAAICAICGPVSFGIPMLEPPLL